MLIGSVKVDFTAIRKFKILPRETLVPSNIAIEYLLDFNHQTKTSVT